MPKLSSHVLCWILLVTLCAVAAAQPAINRVLPVSDLTVETLEKRITVVQSQVDIDAATRDSAVQIYRDAIEQLQQAGSFAQQSSKFNGIIEGVPQRLATIRAELAQPPAEPNPAPPAGATLGQMELSLQQATADLAAARQQAADLQSEIAKRTERRLALTEQIAKARQALANMDAPTPSEQQQVDATLLVEARRLLSRARTLSLTRELESLEAELASYDARRELLPARRDLAQRKVAEDEKLVAAWQSLVTRQRQVEAEKSAQDARRLRREAARQHPVLREFADETAQRATARAGTASISGKIDNTAKRAASVSTKLAALNSRFDSIQRRLDASGLNRATGLLLRHQFDDLEESSRLWKDVRQTQSTLETAEYTLIELQDEREGAGDIDRVAQDLLAQIPAAETSGDRADVEQVARELATARRDLLDRQIADATTYFDRLVELSTTLRQYALATDAYRSFIEERILWVRSISGDRTPRLDWLGESVSWIVDGSAWKKAMSMSVAFMRSRWLVSGLWAGLLLVLWSWRWLCYKRLNRISEQVSRFQTDSLVLTLRALALTMIVASPLALTMAAVGLLLRQPEDQAEVALALSHGLLSAAFFLYPLSFFRQMLRRQGLAESHFRWSSAATKIPRVNLRWFIPTIVPLMVLVAMIDHSENETMNASLGRLLFTIELASLSLFLHRVLRPSGPVLKRFIDENKGGWIYRLRLIWHPLAVLSPFVFAVLSWMGFHYTALHLQSRLEKSLILALVLVVANGLMHRWLFIARRRVAVEDARRRRAQAAEAESKEKGAEVQQDTLPLVDADKVDLPSISGQTRQLFRAAITVSVIIGLFLIWAEALPALRMLDRVQVWPSVGVIEQSDDQIARVVDLGQAGTGPVEVTGGGGSTGSAGSGVMNMPRPDRMIPKGDGAATAVDIVDRPVSITVADLGLSLIVLIATWIAFRNIPGLIEIIVLQRLPLDSGSRYALSTALRYFIAIVGVIIAFNALGISWSKVQWLAAALTFGLAFGLQEIFANFVSGLIILAERPIRLGDTITVGGVTGTVMRIRMRATTISDWDRKELVIPNKTFITGDVINWTLSDPVLRVKIPVGVSYLSDVDQVASILTRVAETSTTVMRDPKPQVLFSGFGDSTLDFELRVFIPHIDYFVPVRNEMHNSIYKAFKAAGVEIAFPQRDLHVRSIGDLSKLIEKKADLAPGEATRQG